MARRIGLPPAHMTEEVWQATFVELLHSLGWRHMHARRSIGRHGRWVTATNVPWPDIIAWHEGQRRVLYAELKTDSGRLSDGQDEVLRSLREAGCEVHVWRPKDWDRIVEVLRGT